MGGGRIVTSKIAIIKPSDRDDADVDYTFAQVGIGEDTIGYDGNCGNISSGVGPFVIDEGLMREFRRGVSVDPRVRTQEVRIYNTGTKKVLISHVPLEEESGKSLESGEIAIDGVPGTGAPILLDYRNACTTTLRC
jgi:2-methylaconitate cis-trans-isomerase PrpF